MIFERYEKKYLLPWEQFEKLLPALERRMTRDRYGEYRISSIYFDTEKFDVARASLEKPVYKEKLRLRSYGPPEGGTPVFLELKKKYHDKVYKRGISLPYTQVRQFPAGGNWKRSNPQIGAEIDQFLTRYEEVPVPAAFIRYDRLAFAGIEDPSLRVTFDTNLRCREVPLELDNDSGGEPLLDPRQVLMEVKTSGAIPLWLCRLLSVNAIFPSSFSKYGTFYTGVILKKRRVPREEYA